MPVASTAPFSRALTQGGGAQSRLRRKAEQFEALFVTRLLKEMQAARLGPNGLGGPGASIYQGMLNNALSQKIAGRDPFGIANLLVRQLGGGREHVAPPVTAAAPPAAKASRLYRHVQATPLARASVVAPAAAMAPAPASVTQARQFASQVLPLLVPAARRLHTTPRVLLAQAALETGWGRHVPRTRSGASSHNVFGVKAGSHWKGPAADAVTHEYEGGWRSTPASFRVYSDLKTAVSDFVRVADHVLGEAHRGMIATARHWGELLHRAGYATDPAYAAKLQAITHGPLMEAVFPIRGEGFKSGPNVPFNLVSSSGEINVP